MPPTLVASLDLHMVEYWVNFLHGDSDGLLHISSNLSWQGEFFSIDRLPQLKMYVAGLHQAGAQGIYLRACTVAEVPRGGGRGGELDSLAFPGFWADIDLAGPGHKTTMPLPPDLATAEQIVQESGLPEPTLWVHSGGGVYPWWLLRQPLTLNDSNRSDIRELARMLDECLASAAARLGYHFGTGISDLARVLRLPGTVNRKVPDAPTQCQLGAQDGQMYPFEELETFIIQAYNRIARVTQPAPQVIEEKSFSSEGESPFDAFEARADWADVLEPAGWQLSHTTGSTRYWVRPGKHRRDGHSATTGRASDRDRLYVFTTETPFTSGQCYTKGAAYAVLYHSGDMRAAARELKRLGYGGSNGHKTIVEPDALKVEFNPQPPVNADDPYELNDTGNAQRLVEAVGDRYRYSSPERRWYRFNGSNWQVDDIEYMYREMEQVRSQLYAKAESWRGQDDKKADRISKFALLSGNTPRVNAAFAAFRWQPGMSVSAGTFDQQAHLLSMVNGTFNLDTGELQPHNSKDMISKQFNASYDPSATCPRFEQFMAEAFPDEQTRHYVQKAMGYSLLGEADQRKLFMLYGPSGTGKSQLTRVMELLYGSYGGTAAASTFRVRRGEVITNDLHDLRGKRFISSSETSVDTVMDEELIKRFTGNDIITSRTLYQDNQSWRPVGVIWMATNHLPQLNSDDDAIWNRVVPIPMNTVFAGREDQIGAFAERVLLPEADGIFNWLLAGVAAYRAEGLTMDTGQLSEGLSAYQVETDTVAQFILDGTEEETLLPNPDSSAPSQVLYDLYGEFCRRVGVRALGIRRFKHRMERLGYQSYRSNGIRWRGLSINPARGVGGTIQPPLRGDWIGAQRL